jgi:O-antigen ligase
MPKDRPVRETHAAPSGAEPALERVAGWSFLLLVAVLPWSIAPMSIALGICAPLTLAVWLRRPTRWPATPLVWPTVAWVAALAVCAWFGLDRADGLPRLTKAFFPLLVPLAVTHALQPRRGRLAVAVLLVSAILAALFGLGRFALDGPAWPNRARGAVGHYMTFGGQLLLFLSVAAGVALLGRGRRWRLGGLLLLLAGGLALAATFTRSAWIGLAVALAVLLGLARPRWLPALGVALAVAFLVAPASYRARAWSAFDPNDPGNLERTYMWRGGIAMFRDHPLTGVGISAMEPIYDRYKPPQATERACHLHSVPIQLAATMGVVGLAAFVLLYGSLFVCAARGLRRSLAAGGVAAGLRAGVTAALAGFLVAGLFEWNFGDEKLRYPLYLLAGLAWAARAWPGGRDDAPAPRGAGGAPAPADAPIGGTR